MQSNIPKKIRVKLVLMAFAFVLIYLGISNTAKPYEQYEDLFGDYEFTNEIIIPEE